MKQVFNGYLHGAERVLLAPAPPEFHLELNFGVGQQPILYLPTDNQRRQISRLTVTRHHLQLHTLQQHLRWPIPESQLPCLSIDYNSTGFSWHYETESAQVSLVRLPEQRLVILGSKRPLDYRVVISAK
ncbi:hypothetical protein [Loigolactobacillus coryniformis]|uniref:Uncharacterized protein n=1 Tax=Loigolactobacillus coryniformis TaxID=1610 RepID=A0A5B8TK91_9LACO|nr:hypothetical protein [Loigolactobacillus coryniformis]QEA54398.1 hypothetical protein FGL77_02340 [Loigolactobacillus coryniformis]RRG06935.1 MAG: hypothetical protein DUD28_01290 [Lactobacillus sp.]